METKDQGGADAHYRAALNEGRSLIRRCKDCHKHVFYPHVVRPHSAKFAFFSATLVFYGHYCSEH